MLLLNVVFRLFLFVVSPLCLLAFIHSSLFVFAYVCLVVAFSVPFVPTCFCSVLFLVVCCCLCLFNVVCVRLVLLMSLFAYVCVFSLITLR